MRRVGKNISKVLLAAMVTVLLVTACGRKEDAADKNSGGMAAESRGDTVSTKSGNTEDTGSADVSPQGDIKSFTEAYLTENRKVLNVQQYAETDFILFNTAAKGKAKYIFEYDSGQSIEKYYSDTVLKNDQASIETNFIYVKPDSYYAKDRQGKWSKVPDDQKKVHSSLGVVDYFKIVNSLAEILVKEQGKYTVQEVNGFYEITIKDRSFDFQTYFRGIIDLTLEGLSVDEVDKSITFKINKSTLLFTSADIKLFYERNGKKIDMKAVFSASDWNKANLGIFEEINK